MSSLPARMMMIDSKIKELECSQDFSYKSMGIFRDAQGQLSMKKIRSKMKALEWTQHFPHYNPMGAIPPRVTCYAELRGSWNSEVNKRKTR